MNKLKKIYKYFHQLSERGRRNLIAIPVSLIVFLVMVIWQAVYLPTDLFWAMTMLYVMFLFFWVLTAWEMVYQVNAFIDKELLDTQPTP